MARQKSGYGTPVAIGIVAALVAVAWDKGYLPEISELLPAASADTGTARYVDPVPGAELTSGFGARWGTTHGGIDLAAPTSTPIRAVADATVIEAGPASGFGLWMRLEHRNGTVTVYGHMNTIDQPAGAHVEAGERIATVGSRGQSTGPHLHLEVWPGGDRGARVDPAPWLAKRGVRVD